VVKSRVAVGEYCAEAVPVEPAEKGLPPLLLLPKPMIQVLCLQVTRATDEVGVRNPQPVGKEPLRRREDLDVLSGDGHPGEGMELHVPQRKGLVKVIGGGFVDLADDVLKSVDVSHGVAPFLWKNGFLLIEDGIAFFRDLPLAVAADGMRGSKGGVLCLLHSHDAPAPGANDIDDQLSPPFSGTKKPPRESPLRAVVLIGSAIWFLS